jgi:malate dehydrogenase (oxaloacetate-decarboxylating)
MSVSSSNAYVIRLNLSQKDDAFSQVIAMINQMGGHIGGIDIVNVEGNIVTRDISITTRDEAHAQAIFNALSKIAGVEARHMSDRTFLLHIGGKIEMKSKVNLHHRDDLSMVYTPGVARVCMAIHESPEKAFNLTIRKNMVAVVSDGTAVLGLGDIGPLAAMPVMEGKAMLFKEFANVDAFPICLDTKDVEEIIRTVKNIAPSFGAINLEDISSPRCFEIENRLRAELDIPVFHDDQHGTAAVMTAALINSLKLVKKKMSEIKIVFNGAGAAGIACTNMLLDLGAKNIIGCDRKGALHKGRTDLDDVKKDYVARTNPNNETGSVHDVLKNADVFVGLSSANILTVDDLKNMNKDPVVFAMANPNPEIMPEIANPHVAIMATGRSDYPNQINNLLAFPGIFRGALDCHATDINKEMKLAAAYAIANCVDEKALSRDYIIPSVFNADVAPAVAAAVMEAAKKTGVIRKS